MTCAYFATLLDVVRDGIYTQCRAQALPGAQISRTPAVHSVELQHHGIMNLVPLRLSTSRVVVPPFLSRETAELLQEWRGRLVVEVRVLGEVLLYTIDFCLCLPRYKSHS